jgi:hypothetical protein
MWAVPWRLSHLVSLALFLLAPAAEAFTVSGSVTELGSGTPLNAFIIAYDSDSRVVAATGRSRSSGDPYSVELPAGTYDFYVRAFGYAPVEALAVVVGDDVDLDFEPDPNVGLAPPLFLTDLVTTDIAIFAPTPGTASQTDDSTTLTLTSTRALDAPVLIYNEFARMKVDGEVLGVIELFDDGTRGDAVAGDLVYSRGGLGFAEAEGFEYCNAFTSALLLLGKLSGDEAGIIALPDAQPLIGVADDYQVTPEVSSGVQWTDHAANLVMDTPALEGTDWIPQVTARFYEEFDDRYDFLYLFPDWVFSIGAAFMTVVHNDVEGIGLGPLDRRAEFGSTGPLQGIVASRFAASPPLLHETMHRWANYLNPPFGGCCHWLYSDVNGQLGGFRPGTLVDNMDGSYSVEALAPNGYSDDSLPYAPLELYVAGMLPIGSLPTMNIAVNAQDAGAFGTFTADDILQLTGQDLVAQAGPRVPAFGAAQTEFTAAFVGVSQRPLNRATMTYLDRLAQTFSGKAFGCPTYLDFTEATNGAGAMDVLIDTFNVFGNGFEGGSGNR